jgi:aldose 1-epimerase
MIDTIHLQSPSGKGLAASFAPGANMVLHSLRLGGRELLATRDGVEAYAERGSTMGIPLLHPWANRLAGFAYSAAGKEVVLDRESELFKRDPGGLPIHGALPSLLSWDVVGSATRGETASLLARLEWGAAHRAFELFPFPHRLEYRARLGARAVEIAVALEPTGDAAVPVSFGFHPYLRIPGADRVSAQMSLPVRRALVHDASMIPTGETEPCEPGLRQLGDTVWDDGFSDLTRTPRFRLAGHGSEVTLTFLRGYRFAQVFAPPGSDFVCFEPMTAPANALVSGADLPVVAPGGRYEAAFEITVG